MEMIALIVSGLALLAAGVCLCLLAQEKKRNLKRNTAALGYADNCMAEAKKDARDMLDAAALDISGRFTTEELAMAQATDEKIAEAIAAVTTRIENLEKGVVPDYEKAIAAVSAVNDFNQGISNLLNYDPREALAAQRERERSGE